jgi:hypothetical protein
MNVHRVHYAHGSQQVNDMELQSLQSIAVYYRTPWFF